jgi:hypothetical protein
MNKLRSLHEAIAADVHDGASIALGCVKDHREFLQLLGSERIEKLRPRKNLLAPAVSFNY